jgi:small subunit ribosomal protein S16
MVRIRLRRVGSKKQPSYRVVAADKEAPRDGRFLEVLGHYNPRTQPETIHLEEDRVFHWLSVGAQPSDSVTQIFKVMGTMERYQRFQAGEAIETLMEEAAAVEAGRNVNPKTTATHPVTKKKKKTEESET